MKTILFKIGNSTAVKIPSRFLKQTKLADEVRIFLRGSEIVIASREDPRLDWEKASKKLARKHGFKRFENTEEDIEWMNAPMGPFKKAK